MIIRWIFSLVFCLIFATQPAWAWNSVGHQTIGAIAYQDLLNHDPIAIEKVTTILRQHPQFESRWQSRLEQVSPEDQNLLLFMLAARWPDDIRGNSQLDRPKWHYINFPYKPDGQPADLIPNDPDPDNILVGLRENQNIVTSVADDPQKAVAWCWLFHQIGDLHQPLHTAALFTEQFPNGDRGGTRFYIKVPPSNGTISLHKFWDDLLGSSSNFQTVRNRAIRVRNEFPRQDLPELSETEFENWGKESFTLAKTVTYRNGTLDGSTDRDNGTPIPTDYRQTSQPIGQKQVALAGYRLADLLSQNILKNAH